MFKRCIASEFFYRIGFGGFSWLICGGNGPLIGEKRLICGVMTFDS
jgi:hypothetical protein